MKYALLIGANYSSNPRIQLNGCIDDIVNMQSMLINNYGYEMSNIVVLRDDVVGNTNMLPTKANMLTCLNNIINNSKNAEQIWIHYSGHGSLVSKFLNINNDIDSCIVPIDFATQGYIYDDDLFRIFSKSKCPTVILMDSCHSGTVCDLPYVIEYMQGNTFREMRTNRTSVDNKNIFLFSGCKDLQLSEETYDIQDKQFEGVFTDSFLKSLKSRNYTVDIRTLYKDICLKVSSKKFQQKPLLSSSSSLPKYTFQYVPPKTTPPPTNIPAVANKNNLKLKSRAVSNVIRQRFKMLVINGIH